VSDEAKWDAELVWAVFGCALLALLIGVFVLLPIVKSARASGVADYCYVEGGVAGGESHFTVFAHRPWRPDRMLGFARSMESAVGMARHIGCEVRP
jgi:hypothetical protein